MVKVVESLNPERDLAYSGIQADLGSSVENPSDRCKLIGIYSESTTLNIHSATSRLTPDS